MKIFMVLMVVSGSSVALAQPAAAPPGVTAAAGGDAADPAAGPGFVAIGALDASSRAGLEASYVGVDSGSGSSLTVLRFEGRARYVDPRLRIGGYVQVPFAYARASDNGQSDTATDFGDVEIGGIFAPRLGIPGLGLILRAGVTLPTGEKGDEAVIGTLASAAALPAFYNALPRSTTIKLGVSPMFRSGMVFGRIDLGFDGNVDADRSDVHSGIHYNAGIGIDLGSAAVMLESENLTVLDSSSDGTLNTVAVSARANAGTVSPYLGIILPIDKDERDLIDFAVTAGVDFKL